MPRVKKTTANLTEENKRIANEIAKLEAQMKVNAEKIHKDLLNRIDNSGFALEEVVKLVEEMAKKNISVQDMLSLIDDAAEKLEQKAEDIGEINAESEKALNEMMATLPSYDN